MKKGWSAEQQIWLGRKLAWQDRKIAEKLQHASGSLLEDAGIIHRYRLQFGSSLMTSQSIKAIRNLARHTQETGKVNEGGTGADRPYILAADDEEIINILYLGLPETRTRSITTTLGRVAILGNPSRRHLAVELRSEELAQETDAIRTRASLLAQTDIPPASGAHLTLLKIGRSSGQSEALLNGIAVQLENIIDPEATITLQPVTIEPRLTP